MLGALAVSCQDGSSGARSFAFVHGLLRPALQVLARELAHQYNVCDLRKNLTSRDDDLELLLDASSAAQESDPTTWNNCCSTVSTHVECALGALIIPDQQDRDVCIRPTAPATAPKRKRWRRRRNICSPGCRSSAARWC